MLTFLTRYIGLRLVTSLRFVEAAFWNTNLWCVIIVLQALLFFLLLLLFWSAIGFVALTGVCGTVLNWLTVSLLPFRSSRVSVRSYKVAFFTVWRSNTESLCTLQLTIRTHAVLRYLRFSGRSLNGLILRATIMMRSATVITTGSVSWRKKLWLLRAGSRVDKCGRY